MMAVLPGIKIAHLILAHKGPDQLKLLIDALDHPEASFYLHIDAKSRLEDFSFLSERANVNLVEQRVSVHWAAWGTIQATLNGFEEILGEEPDYINVISGQDFPIQSAQALHDHLNKERGSEFITCERLSDQWTEAQRRVRRYSFVNWKFPGKFTLGNILSALLPDRKFPFPYELVGRSNWFTITKEAAQYILDFAKREQKFNAFFKLCWGADELYFATILYNSPFKEKIKKHLNYVDWRGQNSGHPKLLDISDQKDILDSDKFFARKIELGKDQGLLKALEQKIRA